MPDLFDHAAQRLSRSEAPLAERVRPRGLDEYVGQDHVIGKDGFLRRLFESGRIMSFILWGPPGSGKTTLARMAAQNADHVLESFSAVLSGVKDLREAIARADERLKYEGHRTVLFVDEIHRWNKAQQDAFLPHVESGRIILIGATTQNPSFEVISPLLSRCRVVVLNSLSEKDIETILKKAIDDRERGLFSKGKELEISEEAVQYIARVADGDARRALNGLELSLAVALSKDAGDITLDLAREAVTGAGLSYDRSGEEHYNQVSAFIKSMRGSDPDAAVYWMVRMLEGGEDPLFILRRMIVFAAEDVGNADPNALTVATSAFNAFSFVGLPEGKIPMAQAVTYLAGAPKSNASYLALGKATELVKKTGALAVPLHLRNAPTSLMKNLDYGKEYKYPHDFSGHYVKEQYLPDEIKNEVLYSPTDIGEEKKIKSRLAAWRARSEEFMSSPPKTMAETYRERADHVKAGKQRAKTDGDE